ncbi:MAG: c-type cytochrome [Burkholderiaceae bacterium]|nr:c-type cytochrome [Burkholderiaceae bacterium]
MSIKHAALSGALLGVLLVSGSALAQTRPDLGKREFDTNCAMCHGLDGQGSGVMSTYLNRQPTNLTTLAKASGGIRPMARMYEVIDGARDVPAHGTREMPAWGNDYRIQAAQYYWDAPYDPEVVVRARILALLEYINRLQVK